jgi:hypothetical protein
MSGDFKQALCPAGKTAVAHPAKGRAALPDGLHGESGHDFHLVVSTMETHRTPSGIENKFIDYRRE